jgi:hypothetical protein
MDPDEVVEHEVERRGVDIRADRLVLLTYETLAGKLAKALRAGYDFVGEPWFEDDFDQLPFPRPHQSATQYPGASPARPLGAGGEGFLLDEPDGNPRGVRMSDPRLGRRKPCESPPPWTLPTGRSRDCAEGPVRRPPFGQVHNYAF